jgi:hypothetical protein
MTFLAKKYLSDTFWNYGNLVSENIFYEVAQIKTFPKIANDSFTK